MEDPEAEKVEAVTDKAAEEVDEVVEKIEETVVKFLVEAPEVEEVEGPVIESKPQQDTRLSLGRGGYWQT